MQALQRHLVLYQIALRLLRVALFQFLHPIVIINRAGPTYNRYDRTDATLIGRSFSGAAEFIPNTLSEGCYLQKVFNALKLEVMWTMQKQ